MNGARAAGSLAVLRALVADPARALRWGVETIGAMRADGVAGLRRRLASGAGAYQRWIAQYDTLSDDDRREIASHIESLERRPLISVLMPVYDVEERWLRRALDSVIAQLYPYWELCVADDASPSGHVRRVLDEYSARDERIRVVYRDSNGHISAASNSALEIARGEFVALLDHDDELAPHALYMIAEELGRHPDAVLVFSDEDGLRDGERFGPIFKPDLSHELLLSVNCISHLGAYRTSVVRSLGGFRLGYEGSQDFDLALRVVERADPQAVRHVPHVLYHWRAIAGSVRTGNAAKEYAHDAARRAIADHLERMGERAAVSEGFWRLHRVRIEVAEPAPLVSIVVRDGVEVESRARTIESIRSVTDYERFELLAADTSESATGDIVVFVRAGLVARDGEWLRELVSHALRSGVGAVGGRIIDEHRRIVHAGLAIAPDGEVLELYRGARLDEPGQLYRAQVLGNYTACSLSLIALKSEHLPLAAESMTKAADDVEGGARLCIALGEAGLRTVWTPYAEMIDTSGSAEPLPASRRVEPVVESYISPNLALDASGVSLAFPPRVEKPWRTRPR